MKCYIYDALDNLQLQVPVHTAGASGPAGTVETTRPATNSNSNEYSMIEDGSAQPVVEKVTGARRKSAASDVDSVNTNTGINAESGITDEMMGRSYKLRNSD